MFDKYTTLLYFCQTRVLTAGYRSRKEHAPEGRNINNVSISSLYVIKNSGPTSDPCGTVKTSDTVAEMTYHIVTTFARSMR